MRLLCAASLVAAFWPTLATTLHAQTEAEETAEQKRERITAERFMQLLERRPRLGTALDKVYGYYVGRGDLEEFVEALEVQAADPPNGNKYMVVGMIQMQRGQDAKAVQALGKAEELLPNEALASYYLGKSLVLLGEVDQAAEAMQRAISKKPPRADTLQIFKDLGRIYQRTGQNEQALEVWGKLESLFPGDTGVKEQVAAVLAEEGAEEAALERYVLLAKNTKDRFRRVEMSIRAAQLKAKLGKTEEALRDFETQLAVVNPESWLYRDIRRRIEEVFWASSDFDGLVDYYTKWTEAHPEDVDAMLRTAHVLSLQKRSPEAQTWFRKAIERAPTNVEARQSLVEALASDGDYAKAAKEMAELVEVESDNPDFIVRWGELVLSDEERSKAERQKEAADIWKRMLASRSNDAVTVSRLADLMRGADLTDEAIQYYKQAISLAESEPQYREYLGEYLHQLQRKDEALAVWEALASGERKSRDNIVRLSEVLSTFGYDDKAREKMAEACEMKPTFGHRARYAELLRENKEYDAALAQLDLAEPMADDRELRELVITERIKNFQAAGTLKSKIDELESATQAQVAMDASAWRMLALLKEADRAFQPACDAILKATEIAPDDVQIWETAAALYERTGQFGDAIKAYRKLSTLDRRFLSNYLTQIASLEVRIGNVEEGLKAGEELLASAPGNSDHYRFFANLCMQVGQVDRGLDVLRRNVRNNPNDPEALNHLASNLANEFQTDEAVELYWRSFDQARTVEDKTPIIESLAELYLRTNRFNLLLDRLEIISREENKPRDGVLWVAAAHQAAGDLGTARELLEQLVRADSRDTRLLEQLVTLSKAEYDFETAAEYQKRLVSIAPTPQGEYLLATFLMELGEVDQAEGLWQKLTSRRGRGAADILTSVNSLITKEQFETAKKLVDRALQKDPENWELLAPAMIVSVRMDDLENAQKYSDRTLKMSLPASTPSEKTKKQMQSMSSRRNNFPPGYQPFANLGSPSTKMNVMQQIKAYLQPSNDPFGYSPYGNRPYEPTCFGDIQTVAEGIQLLAIEDADARKKFIEDTTKSAVESNDPDRIWRAVAYQIWENPQGMYQSTGTDEEKPLTDCLEQLVALKDPSAAQFLFNREYNARNQQRSQGGGKGLSPEELERLSGLLKLSQQATASAGFPSMYKYWLMDELRIAGRTDEAEEMREKLLAESKEPFELIQAASMSLRSLQRGTMKVELAKESVSQAIPLLQKAIETTDSKTQNASYISRSLAETLPLIGEYGDIEDAIKIVDAVIELQARLTAEMRPSQRSKTPTNPRMYYNIRVNNRYERKQVDFPPPSGYFDASTITALHALFETAKSKDSIPAVESAVNSWASDATDDPFLKFARLMAKSSVEYWSGQPTSAAKTLSAAGDLSLGSQYVSLMSARMQYDSGDIRGALKTLNSLQPSNQRMLVDKELSVLELTVSLGDLERAKKSAQKLFALRLQSETEFKLADLMYQLGMREMGDRMMGRIRRKAGGKQDTLVQLMQRYSTAGEMESAVEIARQILRRTQPSRSSNYRSSENVQHQQALQVLVRGKAIDPLIERYEKLVEKSPRSLKFVNQLAAMYEAAGRRKQAQELRMKSAEKGAKDPRSLMQAAQQLSASGSHDKAVDMFLEALKKSPELMQNEYYTLRQAFQAAKAYPKLVDLIEQEGMARFGRNNYRMGELASELARAKQFDSVKKLQKLVLKGGDSYTITYLLENLPNNTELNDDEELAQLVADTIMGTKVDRNNVNFVRSRRSGGVGTGMANYLVRFLAPHEKVKSEVETKMLENAEKDEDDIFSRVILCLLYAEAEKYDQVEELAKVLYEDANEDGASINLMKGEARWAIASQIVDKGKSPELCLRILGCGGEFDPKLYSEKDYVYGPAALYITALENTGDKKRARKVLLEALDKIEIDETQNQYNPGYGEYQYINAMDRLANKLLSSDSPAEAYLAYQKAYGDPDLLAKSQRWSSGSSSRAERLLASIKRKMTPKVVVGLIGKAASGSPDNSHSFLTSATQTGTSMADARIEIPLEQFIVNVDDNKALRQAMNKWATEANLEPSKDLGAIATRLIVANAINSKEFLTEATQLAEAWIKDHPRKSIDAREPDSIKPEQRESLEEDLMLAVIARNLPADSKATEFNISLIERAISAAKTLEKSDLAFGLKCELASQLAARDKEQARSLFLEALDLLIPADPNAN